MFGYIIPNYKELTKEELHRYRCYYCGVCSSLREKCGTLGRLSLTYDLTFLTILLTSLYMPDENLSRERCAIHPFQKHSFLRSEYTAYAADMNILLFYHKLEDDILDEHKPFSVIAKGQLEDAYTATATLYPEKVQFLKTCLEDLRKIESSGSPFLDQGANLFAEILREVFIFRDDRWKEPLGKMAEALGRFIYLLDAVDDYKKDIRKKRPSPFETEPKQEEVREMLNLHISECASYFELLPLIQDVGLLRNILYSGVWTRYELITKRRKNKNGSL